MGSAGRRGQPGGLPGPGPRLARRMAGPAELPGPLAGHGAGGPGAADRPGQPQRPGCRRDRAGLRSRAGLPRPRLRYGRGAAGRPLAAGRRAGPRGGAADRPGQHREPAGRRGGRLLPGGDGHLRGAGYRGELPRPPLRHAPGLTGVVMAPDQGHAAPTMQDALLALTSYWAGRGCLVAQPFNTEVGAGTMNPATVLRVLGPEPWRVAYPEPSVRPDDSRYGENPNRLQTHTQFQVVLKPDPGDPQEQYLGSLEALGIDLAAHDVRFVEDNWASPALGAWGLGWEVWLDGLEITQFTYFQQAGGMTLDPVSVEITYGIERIMMALQWVTHFKDITYAPGISYGEAFGQAEYEMSRYYLDDADVGTMLRLFEEYAAEARRLITARLPVAAHYYVLKCSHVFNVLDARGAVSATERATAFGRMRALAQEVARLWADRRAELGYPLGVTPPPPAAAGPTVFGEVGSPRTALLEI